MKYLYSSILALLLAFSASAQLNYNLIVFTEDNSRFTLFLNNIQQHELPEANVLVSGLNTPMYKARVVFEDESVPPLEKTIYLPEQNSEVTFRIVNKKGTYKMRGFSMVPLPPTIVEVPGRRQVVVATQPVYSQTVTTRTVTSNPDNVNMNVNIGGNGVNVNVSVNDNTNQTVIVEETTTVVGSGGGDHYVMQGYGGPIGCPWPMEEADFFEAKGTIASKDFDDTRLSLAKQIVAANCLFADQVRDIAGLLEFEDTRLEFAKFAYPYTYDIGNYFKVSQVFEFESTTEELNEYIQTH